MQKYSLKGFHCLLFSICCILAAPLASQAESRIIAAGKFEGRSDHVVSGGVTVLKTDSGYVVLVRQAKPG